MVTIMISRTNREAILMKKVLSVCFRPFIILDNVVWRYKKGQKKLICDINILARSLSKRRFPQSEEPKWKIKLKPVPSITLRVIVLLMVYEIIFLLLIEAASETVGNRSTEAEVVKVEGKSTRLMAIPVNTP